MLLIATPSFLRSPVERLTYLPDAGCSDRTLERVEVEHLRLPVDADVIEHPTRVGCRIVNDVLVSDLQNFAGEYRVPVIHQHAVVSELLADPFEVVREPHSALLHRVFDEVVGDRDVAWIAAHRNDLCVRKE